MGVTIFPSRPLIVVKEGSNEICNCGDTLPVNKISTKATLLAWIVDIPKYIVGVIFSFHLSKVLSAANGKANDYIGQNSCC